MKISSISLFFELTFVHLTCIKLFTMRHLKEEERKQMVRCLENSKPDPAISSLTSSGSDHPESEEEFIQEQFRNLVEDHCQERIQSTSKRAMVSVSDIIPSNLASGLDRTNVSDYIRRHTF